MIYSQKIPDFPGFPGPNGIPNGNGPGIPHNFPNPVVPKIQVKLALKPVFEVTWKNAGKFEFCRLGYPSILRRRQRNIMTAL